MEDPTPRLLSVLFIFVIVILAVWSPPTLGSDRDGAR